MDHGPRPPDYYLKSQDGRHRMTKRSLKKAAHVVRKFSFLTSQMQITSTPPSIAPGKPCDGSSGGSPGNDQETSVEGVNG